MLTLLSLLVGCCVIAGTIPSSRSNRRRTSISTGVASIQARCAETPAKHDSLPRVSRHHWTRPDLNRVLGVEDDYIQQISPSTRAVR
jgi:hypothetical protein